MNLSKNNRKFPSKILLFGEYGVLYGTQALAIPFQLFTGQLKKAQAGIAPLSMELYRYISELKLFAEFNLQEFKDDMQNGVVFESTIPMGYGVGSSGALVASIYSVYANASRISMGEIRKDLAGIESFFHGNSSGIDPLVSYLNKPIVVGNDLVRALNSNPLNNLKNYTFFLLDTGITGKTSRMVSEFNNQLKENEYATNFQKHYKLYSDKAINSLLNNDEDTLFAAFKSLSVYQSQHMRMLIPQSYWHVVTESLQTNEYALKINGSGGGGYLLGIARKKTNTLEQLEKKHQILPIN